MKNKAYAKFWGGGKQVVLDVQMANGCAKY